MQLEIKPSHKPIKQYYDALDEFEKHGATKETSVRAAFQEILTTYARKKKWSFIAEEGITLANGNPGSVDGAIKDAWGGIIGYWEAKDVKDDLRKEIDKKFYAGYPKSNIIFQKPKQAILIQDGGEVDEYDLTKPERLAACVTDFLGYRAEEQADWEQIVAQFKDRIPESARKVVEMIEVEKKDNTRFKTAFQTFADLCRAAINPNLADEAVEEMLVQHLLTSRIFSMVFNNPDFIHKNVIAVEIEKVIDALTSRRFTRQEFFAPLDHFYRALENKAKSITDWSQKQTFLNTVYEKFFQGFAVKVADTHGIVYTPQPIVDFMVRSVQHILKTEFKRSLASEGVHILDPFVGTGNFIMRIIREIAAEQKSKLPMKYKKELHCNEVMLLPYYIASMNIEHEYYEQTKTNEPFEGICLVDTFELAEPRQTTLFSTENSERVERQKKSPIFVIIGNPPYNAGQLDENDNNKNRKYPVIDKRISDTYVKDSQATLVNQLSDPYVKAIRFASDRIGQEGIVAFVTNNSFLDGISFDGMRKNLGRDFSSIYHVNLKGNARTSGERRQREAGNVFDDQIRVSIGISFLIKRKSEGGIKIYVYSVDDYMRSEAKKAFLRSSGDYTGINFEEVQPDQKGNWMNFGMSSDFETQLPLGLKSSIREEGRTVFGIYCRGICTNEDPYVYNFSLNELKKLAETMIGDYQLELSRHTANRSNKPDEVLINLNESRLKWIRRTKRSLTSGLHVEYNENNLREALYRPFTRTNYFFDRAFSEDIYQFGKIFPDIDSEKNNLVICLSAVGNTKPFHCLLTGKLPDLHLTGDSQCFPFYTYDEDGSHRKENITDWALAEFSRFVQGTSSSETARDPSTPSTPLRSVDSAQDDIKRKKNVQSKSENSALSTEHSALTKWDIFYYVYGLLHHPEYRTKYAANLRRELPRIPISPDFWAISDCGKQLADLHVNYEQAEPFDLKEVWSKDGGLNFRVEKMKLKRPSMNVIAMSDEGAKKQSVESKRNLKGLLRHPSGVPRNDSSSAYEIIYNKDLTLTGIPAEAFEYRLGNRSAIDWIIDQYQISTDKRSGIVNDPNREEDEQYIIGLLRKVVTVSLETVRLVGEIAQTTLVT